MKKVSKKKLIFSIFFSMLLLSITKVKAYTNEELNELKEIAKHIDISYNLDDACLSQDGEIINGTYEIHVINLTDKIFARLEDAHGRTSDIYHYEDKNLSKKKCVGGGKIKITVYTKGTQEKIYTKYLNLAKYNIYSEREECKDVNIEKIKVCDPWYQGNLTEKTFQQGLKTNKPNSEEPRILDVIFNFLTKYKYYTIALTTIIIIGIATLYNKKKKGDLL